MDWTRPPSRLSSPVSGAGLRNEGHGRSRRSASRRLSHVAPRIETGLPRRSGTAQRLGPWGYCAIPVTGLADPLKAHDAGAAVLANGVDPKAALGEHRDVRGPRPRSPTPDASDGASAGRPSTAIGGVRSTDTPTVSAAEPNRPRSIYSSHPEKSRPRPRARSLWRILWCRKGA
jgi:hypothetical protein